MASPLQGKLTKTPKSFAIKSRNRSFFDLIEDQEGIHSFLGKKITIYTYIGI